MIFKRTSTMRVLVVLLGVLAVFGTCARHALAAEYTLDVTITEPVIGATAGTNVELSVTGTEGLSATLTQYVDEDNAPATTFEAGKQYTAQFTVTKTEPVFTSDDTLTVTVNRGSRVVKVLDVPNPLLGTTINLDHQFARLPYSITVKNEDGRGTATANPATATADTYVTLTPQANPGYKFNSWIPVEPKTLAINDSTFVMPAQNVEVKVVFDPIAYTVVFDANEGTGKMENQGFTYDDEKNLTANTFARTDYTFIGWNTKQDGTGEAFSDSQAVKNLADADGAIVTLYAQWKEVSKAAAATTTTSTTTTGSTSTSTKVDKPDMSTSAGGKFISAGTEVTYTITQKVPSNATSMQITFVLEPVMEYTVTENDVVVTVGGAAQDVPIKINGQTLTVSVDENAITAFRGKTAEVVFKAKVKSGADLSGYLNPAGTTASIPYMATTKFMIGGEETTVSSDTEHIKVAVGKDSGDGGNNGNSSSTGTYTGTATTSREASTLAATSDATALLPFADIAAVGVGVLIAGRGTRRKE